MFLFQRSLGNHKRQAIQSLFYSARPCSPGSAPAIHLVSNDVVSQAYFNADYFARCWCLRAAYTILSIARNEIIRRGRRDAGNGVKPRARGGGKTPKKVFPSQQTLGRVRRSPRPQWVLVPHPATASPLPPVPPAYPVPLRVRPSRPTCHSAYGVGSCAYWPLGHYDCLVNTPMQRWPSAISSLARFPLVDLEK